MDIQQRLIDFKIVSNEGIIFEIYTYINTIYCTIQYNTILLHTQKKHLKSKWWYKERACRF